MTEKQGSYVTPTTDTKDEELIAVKGSIAELMLDVRRLERERLDAQAHARALGTQVIKLTADLDALDALLVEVGAEGETIEEKVRNLLQVRAGMKALCKKAERLGALVAQLEGAIREYIAAREAGLPTEMWRKLGQMEALIAESAGADSAPREMDLHTGGDSGTIIVLKKARESE